MICKNVYLLVPIQTQYSPHNWMDYDLEEMCFLKQLDDPEWFKLMEEAKIDATKKKVLEVILAEEDGDNVGPSSSAEKDAEELSDLESATDA